MRTLTFLWREDTSLALELAAGIDGLYVRTAGHKSASISATLWKGGATGLEINSRMHDIRAIHGSNERIDIPSSFRGPLKVGKLVITEGDVTAESGIALEDSRGEQIIIVAGAFPYTLSIHAPSFAGSNPEYPLDHYRHVLMA